MAKAMRADSMPPKGVRISTSRPTASRQEHLAAYQMGKGLPLAGDGREVVVAR